MEITSKRIVDIQELLAWRREVIEHVFSKEADASLLEANKDYYRRHISDGSHIAFIALCDGEEVGCGAVCITEELPSPDNPSGRCAYLMNIYVREPYRHQGVGARIVENLVECAAEEGCDKIYLETTDVGRPVYASLGFRDMPDMMKLNSYQS